jgi:hypothetical protein
LNSTKQLQSSLMLGAFKGTGACPYQVITSYVVAGLIFSPEAIRAKSAGWYRVDPVVEIKGAKTASKASQ